jgi:hypothetical protein
MTTLDMQKPAPGHQGKENLPTDTATHAVQRNRPGPPSDPVHCKEPMFLSEPHTNPYRLPTTHDSLAEEVHRRVYRCRCGFQIDAPGTFTGTTHTMGAV